MINELPTKAPEMSYKNIFLYTFLFLLIAGAIGVTLYFLVFRKKSCKADKDCKSGQTCVSGKCQVAPPSSDCKSNNDCKLGQNCVSGKCQQFVPPTPSPGGCTPACEPDQTCFGGQCQSVPPTPNCKKCTSDQTLACRKNDNVYCTENSECTSNACGLVTGDPMQKCCVGHVFKNSNNEMVCSLEKGQECIENYYCTSWNCQNDNNVSTCN